MLVPRDAMNIQAHLRYTWKFLVGSMQNQGEASNSTFNIPTFNHIISTISTISLTLCSRCKWTSCSVHRLIDIFLIRSEERNKKLKNEINRAPGTYIKVLKSPINSSLREKLFKKICRVDAILRWY